jgi:hypothetical protein
VYFPQLIVDELGDLAVAIGSDALNFAHGALTWIAF